MAKALRADNWRNIFISFLVPTRRFSGTPAQENEMSEYMLVRLILIDALTCGMLSLSQFRQLISDSEQGADARRVSAASDCSGTRSGPNNRAAGQRKRRVQARAAGLNVTGQGTRHLVEGTLDPLVRRFHFQTCLSQKNIWPLLLLIQIDP